MRPIVGSREYRRQAPHSINPDFLPTYYTELIFTGTRVNYVQICRSVACWDRNVDSQSEAFQSDSTHGSITLNHDGIYVFPCACWGYYLQLV